MKKLGLIGGLSWGSTARYYEIINKGVARRLGGLHSANLAIESLDFSEVARCSTAEYRDWETDRKSTRLNSSHSAKSRMPSSA